MLEDFIYHRDFMLKRVSKEAEISKRTGEPADAWTRAIARAYSNIDADSVDAALACIQWNFSSARRRLLNGKNAEEKNAAVVEIDELALAVRLLTQDIFYTDKKEAE